MISISLSKKFCCQNLITSINPECQIIISSTLPRKNDKLANQLIKQTDESLKQLCDLKPHILMDNYGKLLENAVPNVTLVVNPIKVNSFAYLFNCTMVGRASD